MVSPLNVKVIAGAAALIVGIFGGAYVAGSAAPSDPAPTLGSTTPSRVASPKALPTLPHPAVKVSQHVEAPAPKHKSDRAKHSKHGDDAKH